MTTLMSRPFRVLGMQQIAVGARSRERLRHFWCALLGVPKSGEFESARENVQEDILKLGVGPWAIEIDLMQPLDEHAKPAVHEPALNHVGLWVDDLHAAVDWLTAQGVRFTPGGIRVGAAGHEVAFIHPKGNDASPIGAEGVLVELVQAPPEVIAALTPQGAS